MNCWLASPTRVCLRIRCTRPEKPDNQPHHYASEQPIPAFQAPRRCDCRGPAGACRVAAVGAVAAPGFPHFSLLLLLPCRGRDRRDVVWVAAGAHRPGGGFHQCHVLAPVPRPRHGGHRRQGFDRALRGGGCGAPGRWRQAAPLAAARAGPQHAGTGSAGSAGARQPRRPAARPERPAHRHLAIAVRTAGCPEGIGIAVRHRFRHPQGRRNTGVQPGRRGGPQRPAGRARSLRRRLPRAARGRGGRHREGRQFRGISRTGPPGRFSVHTQQAHVQQGG